MVATYGSMIETETLKKWWPGSESNQRHADFQSAALPTELPGHAATCVHPWRADPARPSMAGRSAARMSTGHSRNPRLARCSTN
jgi:hypothetical protein